MGVIKYLTMDELKILSIPSKMLKLFNHSIFPHKGHPTRSMHPP